MIFEFDGFELDGARLELRHGAEPVHVEPQVFAVLRHLVEHRDRVVAKEELLDHIWGDRFVSESALTSRIKAARRAVGDTGRQQRVIATAHGRGYRFVLPVVERDGGGSAPSPGPASRGPFGTPWDTTLPHPAAPILGRDDDLVRLAEARRESRLVTLVGPGGVGKTRLALEFARRQVGGCVLVDLSAVHDPAALASTFLGVLGVSPRADVADVDRLVEALEERPLDLLVDNCEHVVAATAAVVGRLVHGTRAVTVLATSREALGVGGEQVLVVAPLDLPPERASRDERRSAAAVQLFGDRARRAGATSDELDEALDDVIALCRRLDGMPLALELAAARIRAFSPAQIVTQLDAGWPVLVARRPDDIATPHHGSLDDAIDWSYRLLDDDERALLQACGVFHGLFDLPAVAAVADVQLVAAADVVTRLVEKSLVQSGSSPVGRRFRLLQTVRAFVAARPGDGAAIARHRHAEHFARRVDLVGNRVPGPSEDAALAELAVELDDVAAAFDHAAARGDVATAARLAAGPRLSISLEGARWADLALRAVALPGIEAQPQHLSLLAAAAWRAVLLGDLVRARELAELGIRISGDPSRDARLCWIWPQATGTSFAEGVAGCLAGAEAARAAGDGAAASFLLATAAIYGMVVGDERAAAEAARAALDLARANGSRSLRARAAGALAYALQDVDAAGARQAAEELLEIAPPGDFHLSMARRVLAFLAWRDDDGRSTAEHAAHAFALIRDQGDRYVQAAALRQLAILVGDVDDSAAATLLGMADGLVPGISVIALDAAADARLRARLVDALGAETFAALGERGRRADARAIGATARQAIARLAAGRPARRDAGGARDE